MLHLKGLGAIGALVFHHTLVLVLLTRRCEGESQVIGPSQPIVAAVGDDVVLPCHLEPAVDASSMTVEWTRPDLSPRFVHVWRDGVELENKKHPSYVGRTSVSVNKLKLGDVSLKLSRVKLSDEGTYRCFVPTLNRESTVTLVVGAVSSLIISLMRTENDGVVLQCESKGWYPEPELLWLDGEGKLLSAGRTKTVRGPDDLYTVSSRVTVEKRHSNSFTCRVQQKIINQSRETQIHVPGDFFNTSSGSAVHISIGLTVVVMVIIALVFVVWKRRRQQRTGNRCTTSTTTGTSSNCKESHALFDEKRETVLEEREANLNAQLKELEDEHKDVVGVVNFLMEHKKNLENQILEFEFQLDEAEKQSDEKQSQLVTPAEETVDENKCLDTKTNPDTVKKMQQETDALLNSVICGVTILTEKKKVLVDLEEKIDKQLEEIKEQRQKTLGGSQSEGSIHTQSFQLPEKKSTAAAEAETG
uniref:Butyrophilin subfamily 3 member A2-like n=2 Tax=Seriola dumerili TaxID=41447 RepID=A0A3B4TFR1_SERDU